MKKCLIMLAVLLTMLIVSLVSESENAEMPENAIASNNSGVHHQNTGFVVPD